MVLYGSISSNHPKLDLLALSISAKFSEIETVLPTIKIVALPVKLITATEIVVTAKKTLLWLV